MTTQEIIEQFNEFAKQVHVESKSTIPLGRFVLQANNKAVGSFSSGMKEYSIELWYIYKQQKYSIFKVYKPISQSKEANTQMDALLLQNLYTLLSNGFLRDLIQYGIQDTSKQFLDSSN